MSNQTKTSLANQNAFQIEILFNSVEMELARRWAHGEVPVVFINRPVDHLRKMVKAWWQIYHESSAAANGRDRTVWECNPAYPAKALDTDALIDALVQLRKHLDFDAIKRYRSIHQAEYSALGVLDLIHTYYNQLTR